MGWGKIAAGTAFRQKTNMAERRAEPVWQITKAWIIIRGDEGREKGSPKAGSSSSIMSDRVRLA